MKLTCRTEYFVLLLLSVNRINELTVAEEDTHESADACCDQGNERKHLGACENKHRGDSESRHSTTYGGGYYVDLLEVLVEYKYGNYSTGNRYDSAEEYRVLHRKIAKNSVNEVCGTKKLVSQPGYGYITQACTEDKYGEIVELEAEQSYEYTDNETCQNCRAEKFGDGFEASLNHGSAEISANISGNRTCGNRENDLKELVAIFSKNQERNGCENEVSRFVYSVVLIASFAGIPPTKTSFIVALRALFEMPTPLVALPWGSRSMIKTL